MTCVVGFVTDKGILMGADSAGVDSNYSMSVRLDGKVFIKDGMIFGFTDSFRMGQLLKYKLVIPVHPPEMDPHEYLTTKFIDNVRACLQENGFATKINGVESGGQFLIGYRDRVFSIESDYQVGERSDKYDSVGCGCDIALGSLYSTKKSKLLPKQRVRLALEASAHLSAGVRGPFIILELKKNKRSKRGRT